jgi:hypothetical protein
MGGAQTRPLRQKNKKGVAPDRVTSRIMGTFKFKGNVHARSVIDDGSYDAGRQYGVLRQRDGE